MFIRFVINDLDGDSGRRQGLFQAAKSLREAGTLSAADERQLQDLLDWFNTHLERPKRLSVSRRPHSKAQGISWFKDTAIKHIANMRQFKEILERYGLHVEVIAERRVGYVLYEDEFQVAAYPFKDTST